MMMTYVFSMYLSILLIMQSLFNRFIASFIILLVLQLISRSSVQINPLINLIITRIKPLAKSQYTSILFHVHFFERENTSKTIHLMPTPHPHPHPVPSSSPANKIVIVASITTPVPAVVPSIHAV